MKCPKCGGKEKVKHGYNKLGKRRYLCKECGCNYTKSYKQGYHESIKKRALKLYTEGRGFRRIERLLGLSHVSVINWVKKAAKAIKQIAMENKCEEKVEVLKIDEMCTI